MSFLKKIIPSELDKEEQELIERQRAKSVSVKVLAKRSLSRFEESLLELDDILRKGKEPNTHN